MCDAPVTFFICYVTSLGGLTAIKNFGKCSECNSPEEAKLARKSYFFKTVGIAIEKNRTREQLVGAASSGYWQQLYA